MTVAGLTTVVHNAERPRWSGAGTVELNQRLRGMQQEEVVLPLLKRTPSRNARGLPMTNRGRPEGRIHRARLRQLVLPMLAPGVAVPGCRSLGRLLGIHESEAGRHMKRVLAEDGITTERVGQRHYVVSLQNWRDAA
jgi:hypothetical protein